MIAPGASIPRGSLLFAIGAMLSLVGVFLLGDGPSVAPRSSAFEEESPIQPRSIRVPIGTVDDRSTTWYIITLTNISSSPVKIVGAGSFCGPRGCVKAIDMPSSIRSHESIKIKYSYFADSTGPVELTTDILLGIDRTKGVILPVTFVGSVIDSPGLW